MQCSELSLSFHRLDILVFGADEIWMEKSMEKPIDFRSRQKVKSKRNKANDVKLNS